MLENSFSLRIVVLLLAYLTLVGSQIVSVTSLFDGIIGDRDALKQRINVYSTICGIVNTAFIFVLSAFITKDMVWHFYDKDLSAKNISALWGVSPQLSSFKKSLDIGKFVGIVFCGTLGLIGSFKLLLGFWLTSSISINSHTSVSGDISMSFRAINPNVKDSGDFMQDAQYLSAGLVGQTPLQPDGADGTQSIWVPLLSNNSVQRVYVKDVNSFGIRSGTKLLTHSEVTTTYTPGIATFKRLGYSDITFKGVPSEVGDWLSTVSYELTNPSTDINMYSIFIVSDKPNNTYTGSVDINSPIMGLYYYAFDTIATVTDYRLTGEINSSAARLGNHTKVAVQQGNNNIILVGRILSGLSLMYSPPNPNPLAYIFVPTYVTKWLAPGKILGTPTWNGMNTTWLNGIIVAYIGSMTGNLVGGLEKQDIMAGVITQDSILETNKKYILIGVIIQFVLFLTTVSIYINKRKRNLYHGDDLVYLLHTYIRQDESEESMMLQDIESV